MQTPSSTGDWRVLAGSALLSDVEAAIKADPKFLADAREDLNGAVRRRMGIDFPVALELQMVGEIGYIYPKTDGATFVPPVTASEHELSDADLDLVSGGSSVKTCRQAGNCDGVETGDGVAV